MVQHEVVFLGGRAAGIGGSVSSVANVCFVRFFSLRP